jgi:uncharacterized circularly permuted ATP-grasp superfamily protein
MQKFTNAHDGSYKGLLRDYHHEGFYCELYGQADNELVREVCRRLEAYELKDLRKRWKQADHELFDLGITFTVYSHTQTIDRVLPFDVIPRVINRSDWTVIERGVTQRVAALNAFLHDIYHDEHILRDGVIPAELVKGNKHYRPEMRGVHVPRKTYIHVAGIDLVRDHKGNFHVLEDNARTPSGVSYVLENRHLMMRAFPDLATGIPIAGIDNYGTRLLAALVQVAPDGVCDPNVALLSPGAYNSAYFEHVFLAREMGAWLVEGRDLFVEDHKLFMRTTTGPKRVHVIYRRVDDAYLDPKVFQKDSLLGVAGLFEAMRRGNVTIANAIGTGVADDKAIYAYMPRIIRYYLDEEPILLNVDTNICREPEGLAKTLDNLGSLVVKPVSESGGYGIVIGPKASKRQLKELRAKLKADPANFVSQPVINLSVSPTLTRDGIAPRHVDFRPFAVTGEDSWVMPGGLTRVALKKGSLVVNSSQGGGSKDTWVLG